MQIYTRQLGEEDLHFPLSDYCDPENAVFLDIETTGLNAAYESIYLIGCAAHGPQGWTLTQWFDDTGSAEADILSSFLIYIRGFDTLVHYNGAQFDLPFLTKRIEKLCPEGSLAVLESRKSVDLYALIRPYRKVLGLDNMRQQTVELYLGTGREESESGGELTKVYAELLKTRNRSAAGQMPAAALRQESRDRLSAAVAGDSTANAAGAAAPQGEKCSISDAGAAAPQGEKGSITGAGAMAAQSAGAAAAVKDAEALIGMLIEHNAADVSGLLKITHLLSLPAVLGAKLKVHRAQASRYKDAEGKECEEIVMQCSLQGQPDNCSWQELPEDALYRKLTAAADGCYLSGQGNRMTVKVPLVTGERKYFYANYRDYYYLPAQDQALHKSIASFVEKDHREQAKAENCYTRKKGSFLPEWDLFRTPFFKENYQDKMLLFEFTQDMKADQQFFSDYATYVFRHLTGK